MDKSDLGGLEKKLNLLIKLIAYQVVSEKKLTEGAPILRRIGLTPTEIADVYDTTSNTVNVRLAESKKKAKSISRK